MGQIQEHLLQAKNGDLQARNQLLEEHQLFIYKTARNICRRQLNWGQDEELSIALLAFNEAIDSFNFNYQIPFLAYARLVIKSRLIDFFRREARERANFLTYHYSFEDPLLLGEEKRAWEKFADEIATQEREEELRQYEEELKSFGLSFEDLARTSPKHRDSRSLLLQAAKTLAENEEMFQHLQNYKRIPLQALSKVAKISRKTLEKHRAYIIGVTLIFHKSDEYIYLSSYLKIPQVPTTKRRD